MIVKYNCSPVTKIISSLCQRDVINSVYDVINSATINRTNYRLLIVNYLCVIITLINQTVIVSVHYYQQGLNAEHAPFDDEL